MDGQFHKTSLVMLFMKCRGINQWERGEGEREERRMQWVWHYQDDLQFFDMQMSCNTIIAHVHISNHVTMCVYFSLASNSHYIVSSSRRQHRCESFCKLFFTNHSVLLHFSVQRLLFNLFKCGFVMRWVHSLKRQCHRRRDRSRKSNGPAICKLNSSKWL